MWLGNLTLNTLKWGFMMAGSDAEPTAPVLNEMRCCQMRLQRHCTTTWMCLQAK